MLQYNDVRIGAIQVDKVYCGTDLVFEKKPIDTIAPITTVYPDPTNVNLTHYAGTKVWLEVNEMCTTYFTLDGSTPTTASPIFREAFTLNETTTIKYFSVDLAGNVEAVKTTVFDIVATADLPTTTISPSATVQNTIPVTVTLTTDEAGATIYYRLGTGTQQTYTAPFTVNQDAAGVQSTQITVTYWAVGANGTEAEKSITYNTSGAIPAQPVVQAIAGNWYVRLNWQATANTTSYNVYRSTAAGTLGTMISQYQTANFYDDNDAANDTTFYYTVRAANYGQINDSAQVSATPTSTGAPSINWTLGQNVSIAADGTITKISGGDLWNAGAQSTEEFDGTTDYILEYIPATTDVRIAFGFDEVIDGIEAYRNKDIDFNWEINPAGLNEITVNEIKQYEGTYAAGDVFRVALESGIIRFYQNGNLIFENIDPINFPLVADVAMYIQGQSFKAELITPEPEIIGWRYLKIEGYGSVEEPATTRVIEFEAWEGAVNAMRETAFSITSDAISTGGTLGTIHDGLKVTSGYPIWWTPTPNANIVIDFATQRAFTKLNYFSYSNTGVQRANRFKVLASNTNNGLDWVTIWDMSANTTPQPVLPLGYEKVL